MKKYYQETKQKADRDKMNPVYKRFSISRIC